MRYLLALTCFATMLLSAQISVESFVLESEIGTRYIDKKKLNEAIDALGLTGKELKNLKAIVKQERKSLKKTIKAHNKAVYAKRREEEFEIRKDLQKDPESAPVSEPILATKTDKLFDAKPRDKKPKNLASIEERHPVKKQPREDFPWDHEIDSIACRWNTVSLDRFEKDTLKSSLVYPVFDALKPIAEKVHIALAQEGKELYFEFMYECHTCPYTAEKYLQSGDVLMVQGKEEEHILVAQFVGTKRYALSDAKKEKQQISGRFLIDQKILPEEVQKEWKWLKLQGKSYTRTWELSTSRKSTEMKQHISSIQALLKCATQHKL